MDYKINSLNKIKDQRGNLIVFLQETELNKKYKKFGQIYFVTFNKKGVVRGNHYHKKWREWFGVVTGKIEVILEDINTKEKNTFILDATIDKYKRLEIGPNIAHSFKSLSHYAALLNYATSEWSNEDCFPYKLF